MRRWLESWLAAAATMTFVLVLSPGAAEAHGLRGFHAALAVRGLLGGPFAGTPYGNPYCGFNPSWWAPCDRPSALHPANSFQLRLSASSGAGTVSLDVQPATAEVWVDGRFVAEARDLEESGAPLWLQDGPHHLVIYEDGYHGFEQSLCVEPGRQQKLRVRLEKGGLADRRAQSVS
jgi:hypothetical protein